jgi:rhodanese-related sulfurtransferase
LTVLDTRIVRTFRDLFGSKKIKALWEDRMNYSIFWKRDLFWSTCLIVLVSVFGVFQNWPLVRASLQGELDALLEKHRTERRQAQFKGIKTVNLDTAHAVWQTGQTLIIDARPIQDYLELHVPGAVNLPPESWANLTEPPKIVGLNQERQILVYCSQESCDDALKLATKLHNLGFSRVMAFTGGFRAWDEAGYPVDTSS